MNVSSTSFLSRAFGFVRRQNDLIDVAEVILDPGSKRIESAKTRLQGHLKSSEFVTDVIENWVETLCSELQKPWYKKYLKLKFLDVEKLLMTPGSKRFLTLLATEYVSGCVEEIIKKDPDNAHYSSSALISEVVAHTVSIISKRIEMISIQPCDYLEHEIMAKLRTGDLEMISDKISLLERRLGSLPIDISPINYLGNIAAFPYLAINEEMGPSEHLLFVQNWLREHQEELLHAEIKHTANEL